VVAQRGLKWIELRMERLEKIVKLLENHSLNVLIKLTYLPLDSNNLKSAINSTISNGLKDIMN
jgi:hypothetical protein